MAQEKGDEAFIDSIPEIYERLLVPLIFESYAADLAKRLAAAAPGRVLEIAAGTGVLTRALDATLPDATSIVATDLNPPMLAQATAIGTRRPIDWRTADALNLPFEEGRFDAVVCQFGVMFFPDRTRAYSEVHRVLRPGGRFLFNVWDRIETNEFAQVTEAALERLFPENPPRFFSRTPHGHYDTAVVERELAAGGFSAKASIHTVAARSRAASPHIVAEACCLGSPLRNEIEARDPARLADATALVAEAIAQRFGKAAVDGKIQAHVFDVVR